MKKNLFVTVTLALMLAFSMAVVGCSNPAGGDSIMYTVTFNAWVLLERPIKR